jgi:hypothetical protein
MSPISSPSGHGRCSSGRAKASRPGVEPRSDPAETVLDRRRSHAILCIIKYFAMPAGTPGAKVQML